MMPLKTCFLSLLILLPVNQAAAEACRLDHATYREGRSGAVIQFRSKDTTTAAPQLIGLFQMRLPNISEVFEGAITWSVARYARPDGSIERECYADEDDESGTCWLWTGNVYGLANTSAAPLTDADMMAPKAILLTDFGRSLAMMETFVRANPDRAAFDVFTLTVCSP